MVLPWQLVLKRSGEPKPAKSARKDTSNSFKRTLPCCLTSPLAVYAKIFSSSSIFQVFKKPPFGRRTIDLLRILFLEKVMSCPVQGVGREGCSPPDPCRRHQCVSCMTNSSLKESVHSRLLLRLGHWCTDQKNAPSLCCTDVHIEQQDFAWFVVSWISERPGLEGDLAEEHSTRWSFRVFSGELVYSCL